MNVQAVIAREDFSKLVLFAIKRYRIKLSIPIEDFTQEVAKYILLYKPKKEIRDTTLIVKASVWTAKTISKREKRKKRNLGKPDLSFEDIQVSVDHDFGQYERDEQFRKNISLLTPKQREVILMRLDGIKVPEICQRLNCTPQNVHLLIQNGLKNIRKRF